MRGACGRIGHLAEKNAVGDPCGIAVTRVARLKPFHLAPPGHPWLELPGPRDHLLDRAAPSAEPRTIEYHMCNGHLADLRLAARLEDDGANEVITGFAVEWRELRLKLEQARIGASETHRTIARRRQETVPRISERSQRLRRRPHNVSNEAERKDQG